MAAIMLIPDEAYTGGRPRIKDHHLTLAYFGNEGLSKAGFARLVSVVGSLARFNGGPVPAVANGIGLFDAGSSGVAVVDLIDGIGTFHLRAQIETLFGRSTLDGVAIDRLHGFTPHITREYVSREDDFYAEVGANDISFTSFNFIAIGLWDGERHYEVAL